MREEDQEEKERTAEGRLRGERELCGRKIRRGEVGVREEGYEMEAWQEESEVEEELEQTEEKREEIEALELLPMRASTLSVCKRDAGLASPDFYRTVVWLWPHVPQCLYLSVVTCIGRCVLWLHDTLKTKHSEVLRIL